MKTILFTFAILITSTLLAKRKNPFRDLYIEKYHTHLIDVVYFLEDDPKEVANHEITLFNIDHKDDKENIVHHNVYQLFQKISPSYKKISIKTKNKIAGQLISTCINHAFKLKELFDVCTNQNFRDDIDQYLMMEFESVNPDKDPIENINDLMTMMDILNENKNEFLQLIKLDKLVSKKGRYKNKNTIQRSIENSKGIKTKTK